MGPRSYRTGFQTTYMTTNARLRLQDFLFLQRIVDVRFHVVYFLLTILTKLKQAVSRIRLWLEGQPTAVSGLRR
jgi:hypothetical protein